MKRVLSTVAVLSCLVVVIGCATQSRIAVWDKSGEKLSIQAKSSSPTPFATKITLYINGEIIASGSTSVGSTILNLTGKYKNFKVDAECKASSAGGFQTTDCKVYVDNVLAAEFSL